MTRDAKMSMEISHKLCRKTKMGSKFDLIIKHLVWETHPKICKHLNK